MDHYFWLLSDTNFGPDRNVLSDPKYIELDP